VAALTATGMRRIGRRAGDSLIAAMQAALFFC
jgi:hypothetical protein